jgi:hypothetical protein
MGKRKKEKGIFSTEDAVGNFSRRGFHELNFNMGSIS